MNKKQIETSIKRSIALDTPDLFEQIASTPVQKLSEEDYIVKSRPKQKHGISKLQALFTAFSSIAIMFAICFGFIHSYYSVDSIIAIDVNPSVEITLNKSYKVLSVRANNEDGEKLIQNKSFKNKSCDAVIAELANSLSSEGYIDKDKNSILVSVSNANEIKADEVKSRVVTDIKTTLNEKEIDPVIYKQSISNTTTKKLEALAKKYHISFGKMQLIHSLIEKDSTLTVEELAPLPIEEIPDYVEKRQIKMADVIECEDSKTVVAQKDNTSQKNSSVETKTTASVSEQSSSTASTTITTNSETTSTGTSITTSNSTSTSNSSKEEQTTNFSCGICPANCTCPNCLSEKGCPKGCELCPAECPNSADNISNSTASTATNTTVNKDTATKPDKTQKPNKGDKDTSTSQDISNSSTETNDIENSGSYEDSTNESTQEPTTSTPPTTEDDVKDLGTSGNAEDSSTSEELEDTDSVIEMIPSESSPSHSTSTNTVSGDAYSGF